MFKKIISGVIASMLMLSSVVVVNAQEFQKLSFDSKKDWSMTQGENSWYYQYTTDGTYTGYKNMTWATKGSNTTYHGSNATGAFVDNFYVKDNAMHIGGGNLKSARVWVAPYPGVVRVASAGNIRKLSNSSVGEIIYANIVKTDKSQKNEKVLWSCGVKQGDNIGNGNTYSFDIEVDKGDRIYFEISGSSAANGGVYWETTVDYRQAAYFSKSGKQIGSVIELEDENIVDCVFYDQKNIEEDAKLYMVVYDRLGRMRKMSKVTDVDIDSFTDRQATLSVSMPKLAENETYSGWNIKLYGITANQGRYWPVEISGALCLD